MPRDPMCLISPPDREQAFIERREVRSSWDTWDRGSRAPADVARCVQQLSVTVSEHAQLPATADSAVAHGISCTLYSNRVPAAAPQKLPVRLSLASKTSTTES